MFALLPNKPGAAPLLQVVVNKTISVSPSPCKQTQYHIFVIPLFVTGLGKLHVGRAQKHHFLQDSGHHAASAVFGVAHNQVSETVGQMTMYLMASPSARVALQ